MTFKTIINLGLKIILFFKYNTRKSYYPKQVCIAIVCYRGMNFREILELGMIY